MQARSREILFDVQVAKTLHSPHPPNLVFSAHSRFRKTFPLASDHAM